MFVGRSENCAVTKSKGTPSDRTSCTGLMNVDLGALMMANLQSSRDAHLRVANPQSRSTDKARQPGPLAHSNMENGATSQEFCGACVGTPTLKESIEVVGHAQGGVVYASH